MYFNDNYDEYIHDETFKRPGTIALLFNMTTMTMMMTSMADDDDDDDDDDDVENCRRRR